LSKNYSINNNIIVQNVDVLQIEREMVDGSGGPRHSARGQNMWWIQTFD